MPNLEQSIAEWRKTMRSVSRLASETLTELENHLRETVEQLVRSGIPEAQAFAAPWRNSGRRKRWPPNLRS